MSTYTNEELREKLAKEEETIRNAQDTINNINAEESPSMFSVFLGLVFIIALVILQTMIMIAVIKGLFIFAAIAFICIVVF